jgi:hypothetical protein
MLIASAPTPLYDFADFIWWCWVSSADVFRLVHRIFYHLSYLHCIEFNCDTDRNGVVLDTGTRSRNDFIGVLIWDGNFFCGSFAHFYSTSLLHGTLMHALIHIAAI